METKWIGVGFRRQLAHWIDSAPPAVNCLELTAEHFFHSPPAQIQALRARFKLFVHGLGLSLGTPGPLNPNRLNDFARVAEAAQPEWISEHIAFTHSVAGDLSHLNPVLPTRRNVGLIADHARQLADRCARPIILENITSHLRIEGELAETDFLNEICAQAGCGLLLDVTNLFINSRNHRFDPLQWLHSIEPNRLVQLHLVGFARAGERWTDDHAHPIQSELLALTAEVLNYAPGLRAIILERDAAFPGDKAMAAEVAKLTALLAPRPV